MDAGGDETERLIGVARHADTERVYALVLRAGSVLAEPQETGDSTWIDAAAIAPTAPELVGPWKHFKGPTYDVVGRAKEADSTQPLVVYLSADGRVWLRPEHAFEQIIERDDYRGPRFVRSDQGR